MRCKATRNEMILVVCLICIDPVGYGILGGLIELVPVIAAVRESVSKVFVWRLASC